MSEQVANAEKLMQRARQSLAATEEALKTAIKSLRDKTVDGGRISSSKLDEYQLVSYETALSAAEAAGAWFALDYAERIHEERGAVRPWPQLSIAKRCRVSVRSSLR